MLVLFVTIQSTRQPEYKLNTSTIEEFKMKNVGGIDKILRIIAGAGLIASVFLVPTVMNPWGWIGVVPLLTGLFNFCPLYPILGISTSKANKD